MSHLQGKFVWIEHVSSDAKRAQTFYGEVLGWKVEGAPMGDFTYEMIKAGDTTIGGYATPHGEPPHWISYVSVDDVDATAKAIRAAGGKVLGDPSDIPGVGRMARCADPLGATFNLFHSVQGDPEDQAVRPAGHVDWNELTTPEPDQALAFYEKILGYSHDKMDMPNGAYLILKKGETARGGIMKSPAPGIPAMWTQYIAVDDADAAVTRATRGGGRVALPAMSVPDVGRFAILVDPLGAVFGVIKPAAR